MNKGEKYFYHLSDAELERMLVQYRDLIAENQKTQGLGDPFRIKKFKHHLRVPINMPWMLLAYRAGLKAVEAEVMRRKEFKNQIKINFENGGN